MESKYITVGGENIDIGCGNAFGGEGAEEGGDEASAKVLDLVNNFQYKVTRLISGNLVHQGPIHLMGQDLHEKS